MTPSPHTNEPGANRWSTTPTSRRRFLAIAAAGAAGAVALPSLADRLLAAETTTGNFGPPPGGRTAASGGVDPGLILVSIQLGGGVDFLNSVVPLNDSRYGGVRGAGTLAGEASSSGEPTLHPIDDGFALNSMPHLAERWAAGDLAVVHGVGWEGSSLSHFDATDMWEKGSPDFGVDTGWIGRALGDLAGNDADPLLGLSMGGVSPSMYAEGWSAVGLQPGSRIPWSADFRRQYSALDRALADQRTSGGDDLVARARDSQLELRGLGARLGPIVGNPEDREVEDDGGEQAEDELDTGFLSVQLDLVADLIDGGIPTRAFHVMQDGYDTHANQRTDLPLLLGALDSGIKRFQARLGPAADRVVIATWTEFGRRPEWNGDGTEHGTAGVQFVVGPKVKGGHHGEPSPLDRFDRDDNFVVTTDFRDYLSGVTLGTLGADPARVVDGGRGTLDLVEA